MGSQVEHTTLELDPMVIGCGASAPLTDATRRVMMQAQMDMAALETTEKMAERARLMFLILQNGPHSSGMMPYRMQATNGALELVAKVAHTVWTAG